MNVTFLTRFDSQLILSSIQTTAVISAGAGFVVDVDILIKLCHVCSINRPTAISTF